MPIQHYDLNVYIFLLFPKALTISGKEEISTEYVYWIQVYIGKYSISKYCILPIKHAKSSVPSLVMTPQTLCSLHFVKIELFLHYIMCLWYNLHIRYITLIVECLKWHLLPWNHPFLFGCKRRDKHLKKFEFVYAIYLFVWSKHKEHTYHQTSIEHTNVYWKTDFWCFIHSYIQCRLRYNRRLKYEDLNLWSV